MWFPEKSPLIFFTHSHRREEKGRENMDGNKKLTWRKSGNVRWYFFFQKNFPSEDEALPQIIDSNWLLQPSLFLGKPPRKMMKCLWRESNIARGQDPKQILIRHLTHSGRPIFLSPPPLSSTNNSAAEKKEIESEGGGGSPVFGGNSSLTHSHSLSLSPARVA